MILLGDCLERLKELPDNSVDSVVTDPPYGLSFMGKKWDYDVPSVELWREALRVIKPGGHLLSFGGTRTYHRMVVAIEDAGFEIRDQIQWLYGSGFPKSHDISKGIDKAAGAEREVVGKSPRHTSHGKKFGDGNFADSDDCFITAPSTDAAKQWQGWGSSLKPANEPIVLARKPLSESTLAKNVLKWGVGGLNIDASRIGTAADMNANDFDDSKRTSPKFSGKFNNGEIGEYRHCVGAIPNGRWPANLILDEQAAFMLDEQSGIRKSGGSIKSPETSTRFKNTHSQEGAQPEWAGHQDSGGASRFFYVAKASKRERNAGLEGMPEKRSGHQPLRQCAVCKGWNVTTKGKRCDCETPTYQDKAQANHHPTVKPLKLMEYLIKLITPPGGCVLDPFAGSGSTGVAAFRLGYKFIGCEMNEEYCEIAKKRIEHAAKDSAS